MYHFIMNPKASSGKGMKVWETIENILIEEKVEYKAHVLNSAQETIEFVQILTGKNTYNNTTDNTVQKEGITVAQMPTQDKEDCHIVVLGGDGTINAKDLLTIQKN